MKKIIVRLGNGLGNQLFTYAAAYSFAKKINVKLYIDDESGFQKRNKYELHNFNISTPIIDKGNKFLGFFGKIKRKIFIKFNNKKKFLIESKDKKKLTNYEPKQFNITFKKILYIEGYFQSEKYFENDIKNIKKEFSFKEDIKNENLKLANEIKMNNSISIHLRHEKFLSSEGHENINELNKDFLDKNMSIINKGIKFFDKEINNPKYYVWSNNFTEIRNLFPINKFKLVDVNLKKDPAYDLYLMSLCKHFILSPSTMHYWAAFLSDNPNKICLSPTYGVDRSGYYSFSNNKDIKPKWWREI